MSRASCVKDITLSARASGAALEHKSIETLLLGFTDANSAWDEARGDFLINGRSILPPALLGRLLGEPKWVDLAAYRNGPERNRAKFTELAADFAAAVHGLPKEDLLSEEVRQQRRMLTLACRLQEAFCC
jgi:hypothetical protein